MVRVPTRFARVMARSPSNSDHQAHLSPLWYGPKATLMPRSEVAKEKPTIAVSTWNIGCGGRLDTADCTSPGPNMSRRSIANRPIIGKMKRMAEIVLVRDRVLISVFFN
jgi:hypothetical protein